MKFSPAHASNVNPPKYFAFGFAAFHTVPVTARAANFLPATYTCIGELNDVFDRNCESRERGRGRERGEKSARALGGILKRNDGGRAQARALAVALADVKPSPGSGRVRS